MSGVIIFEAPQILYLFHQGRLVLESSYWLFVQVDVAASILCVHEVTTLSPTTLCNELFDKT